MYWKTVPRGFAGALASEAGNEGEVWVEQDLFVLSVCRWGVRQLQQWSNRKVWGRGFQSWSAIQQALVKKHSGSSTDFFGFRTYTRSWILAAGIKHQANPGASEKPCHSPILEGFRVWLEVRLRTKVLNKADKSVSAAKNITLTY